LIGRIQGTLIDKQPPQVLVDVHGVGYELSLPMSSIYPLPESGQTVTLHTQLVVREDSQTLYGFLTLDERSLFRSLIRINGVGAKLALAILSGMSVSEFIQCIEREDLATLVKMPGVGKKTAERLLIEMKDRIRELDTAAAIERPAAATATAFGNDAIGDAVSALVALGYKPQEASRMVRSVDNMSECSSQELIRLALKGAVK
jgi:Holliday junction DNA helicase RuvA